MSKIGSASQLLLLAFCLGGVVAVPSAATPSKNKADQTRPQTKALSAKPSAIELERKGKKAVQPVKPEPSKTTKSEIAKTKDKQLAKAGKPANEPVVKGKMREQEASKEKNKLASKARKGNQAELALLEKNGKAKNSKDKAAKQNNDEKVLSSRLVRASFTSNNGADDRRGKFGKASAEPEPKAKETAKARSKDIADPPALIARTPRQRENHAENDREEERPTPRENDAPARRSREAEANDGPAYQIALPDQIEVIEYGSTSPLVTNLLALPVQRPSTPFGAVVTRSTTLPNKRNDLNMSQQRILEIQYELAKRGFYNAEPNGVYDEATIAAMWEFQKNYGLPATGYPSAHALKRLGLTTW